MIRGDELECANNRHGKTIARARIARAGCETPFADAHLRILTNTVTSLDPDEMTALDEQQRRRLTNASSGSARPIDAGVTSRLAQLQTRASTAASKQRSYRASPLLFVLGGSGPSFAGSARTAQ
jgi:hypothetical protein